MTARRWSRWLGSLPATWVLERGPRAAALGCGAALALRLGGAPVPPLAVIMAGFGFGAWLALLAGHAWVFAACRRKSRTAGLRVLVVVPESACFATWLCRRRGLAVPGRRDALAVHVDDAWRPPVGLTPEQSAREFGCQYRADYDRLLADLAGKPVLVLSSTFNRHESDWTRRAAAETWCQQSAGPLLAAAPSRHGPRRRVADQRRMFGGVVNEHRVDRPSEWRTRVFDCLGADGWTGALWYRRRRGALRSCRSSWRSTTM